MPDEEKPADLLSETVVDLKSRVELLEKAVFGIKRDMDERLADVPRKTAWQK